MKDHQPIDITTLALEPSIPSRDTEPFDPERDITKEDWEEIIEEFKWETAGLRNPNSMRHDLYEATTLAQAVILLSPQRVALLGLDEIPLETVKKYLDNLTNDRFVRGNSARVAPVKISFQKYFDPIGITDNAWSAMLEKLNFHRRSEEKGVLLKQAYGMAILDPSRTDELGLDEETQQNLFQHVKFSKAEGNWFNFSKNAAMYKVLFPQDTSRLDAELDGSTWQKLKANSKNYRHLVYTLCNYFTYLAILSAQKVEITDRGIELVFDRSESFKEQIPPMPVMKRF